MHAVYKKHLPSKQSVIPLSYDAVYRAMSEDEKMDACGEATVTMSQAIRLYKEYDAVKKKPLLRICAGCSYRDEHYYKGLYIYPPSLDLPNVVWLCESCLRMYEAHKDE